MGGELLLVGSVALDSVKEVLETFGATLGRHLSAVPDGEVGPRRHWISRVHYAEIDKIVELIPAKDLAIQWDCSTEVLDAYGTIAALPREGVIERNIRQFRHLCARIPADVALGYHFCFGTLGGWPRFRPDDLGAIVTLANAIVDASARRVDWIHIPVLDRADDAFYAPLARLEPRGARVYLGAI